MQCWTRVRVETDAARSADVEQWLQAEGAVSVSTECARPEQEASWLQEATEWPDPAWQRVRLTALFDFRDDADQLAQRLRKRLEHDPGHRVDLDTLPQSDWSQTWRQGWEDMRFGGRLVVSGDVHAQAKPADTVVLLEPGLAFGTGSHESTALCLERLVETDLAGRDVLDYGCGSGILAIAALALGARSAVAVDVDPQALDACRANAERNGVSPRLIACYPRELPDRPCADIVIANILANALIRLAPRLLRLARPGAGIWLSGLLPTQAAAVSHAYAPRVEFTQRRRGEWVLLTSR